MDRFSLAAMVALAALCLLVGVLPGLVIDALGPVVQTAVGDSMPIQSHRVAVDRAGRGEPELLQRPLVAVFIPHSARWPRPHNGRSAALRRAPAWDCGFPDPNPAIHHREL